MLNYAYVAGVLKKGTLYTMKFTRGFGVFYSDDFRQYIEWYLSKNVRLVSVTEKGIFTREIYVTVEPIVENLTSTYLQETTKTGIKQFRAKYTPEFAMADLTFIDIYAGSTVDTIKEEERLEREKGLPGWAKDLVTMGGIALGATVVVLALIKRV